MEQIWSLRDAKENCERQVSRSDIEFSFSSLQLLGTVVHYTLTHIQHINLFRPFSVLLIFVQEVCHGTKSCAIHPFGLWWPVMQWVTWQFSWKMLSVPRWGDERCGGTGGAHRCYDACSYNFWWFLLEIYQGFGVDGLAVEESSSNRSY